ncbi:hypothetical protein CHS0354_026593 [Potamilus streckersoni]|uniref:2-methoxy-6-polyprenyl-1,4-benzoquinol methylase, mitochondrial n=1 Tax=Potamilus streckersoni TaxID=2493646 RepID=A0AAE0W2X5_9BIVA|nr:hypothetical protein CHS0354_026593 [Potamilus streckersoni]
MAASLTRRTLWTQYKLFYRKSLRFFTISANHTSENGNKTTKEDVRTTHFGFESVAEKEKEDRVYEVFQNVATRYDLMNDAMSVGIHRLWKDYFMYKLSPLPGTELIDVAGGTGDIAFRFLKYVESQQQSASPEDKHNMSRSKNIELSSDSSSTNSDSTSNDDEVSETHTGSESHVTVCDINQSMLDVGKMRAKENGIYHGISWLKGNAESLPVKDNTFDAYTIAFGIRNCTHIDKVVSEAYRVLRPGGRFMCLEFSQVHYPFLQRLYDAYSFQVIPVLGQVLAKDWKSYQYLVESIRQFPDQEDFKDLIKHAGFCNVTYENLTFGVVAIHSGFKL